MAPEEAARALSRREPGVPGTVLAALDHWLILANYEKAPEAAWLKRVRPDSPGARFNLGNNLVWAGRLDEAVVAYRQAIGLKPDYFKARLRLGLALDEWGQFDEAIVACRRAVELKPDDPDAHHSLGISLGHTGRVDEAVAAYRKAIAIKPDYAESHCNLGLALQHQGKIAEALKSLERGHELGSRRKDWHYASAEWARECRRQFEVAGRPR
jgi:Flp pilus assembly protein TadD